MRIGVNADEANVESPVGVGQFALSVICELEKIDEKNQYFLYLTSLKKSVLPKERAGWCYKYIWPKKFSTQIALPFNLILNREKLDVFFTPTHYAPRVCPLPSVVSIMDVAYLKFPQYFAKKDLWQLSKWTAYSVRQAKKVIAISGATKRDVVEFYGKRPEDVNVCYPGYSQRLKVESKARIVELKKLFGVRNGYLIAIGTLQPRKNYERLIRVFADLKGQGRKEQLLICGKKGWLYESIFEEIKRLNLEEQVIFTDYLIDKDLAVLLAGASAFIFPSLYEGFGIPILEAQAAGVPVIVSKASSFPEVAGKAALYFNPQDEKDMAAKILYLLGNEKLQEKLKEEGYENVKRFNWDICANQVLKTIEQAVYNK